MGRLAALVMVYWVAASADLWAQPPSEGVSDSRPAGSYLKVGLAHWQGDIFSEGRLTHWNVDLFGANYNLTSVNVVFDMYWRETFLQLSGFSLGYRKDVIRHPQSGHMFNGALFRVVDLKVVGLKAGVGVEWGMPSLNFDQTEFEFAGDGTTRSRHTSPVRNVDVPFIGTTTDGALYPFIELSAIQRPGPFLVEAGLRINRIGFHFDDYEVSTADEVTVVFDRKKVLVPYLFVNIGIRMF